MAPHILILIGDIEKGVVEQERSRRYCGFDGRISVLYYILRCRHLGSAGQRSTLIWAPKKHSHSELEFV